MDVRAPVEPATAWNLEAFFSEFYPKIHRFVSIASGAPSADVDDLVQETLLAAWRDRESYRGDGPVEPWIFAIARNRVRRRFRKEGRRKEIRETLAALASLESLESPEEVLRAIETGRQVRGALDRLDPGYAEVLVLKYLEGRNVAWIAEKLGETEKAVESRLFRAKEELRTLLKRTTHELEP